MKKLLFILLLIGLGNTTLQAQDFKKGTFILMEAQSPEMPQTIKVNGIKTFASSQTTSFSRFTDNKMPSLYPKKVKKGEIDMSSAAQKKSAYTNSAIQSFSSLKINTKNIKPIHGSGSPAITNLALIEARRSNSIGFCTAYISSSIQ